MGFEEVSEGLFREEADVLGEHREDEAHEELGDKDSVVAFGFEGLGEFGEAVGDVAGDTGGVERGIEREWIGPDFVEAFADGVFHEPVDCFVISDRMPLMSFAGFGPRWEPPRKSCAAPL